MPLVYKYIYWRPDQEPKDGLMAANVHLLVGYNSRYLTDFQKMAVMLRETFPFIEDSEIRCGKVTKSTFAEGFSLVMWEGYLPQDDYEGWTQREKFDPDYYFI